MARTKEWIKFGALVAVTFGLAAAFVGAVDGRDSAAAEQRATVLETLAATQPAPLLPEAQPAVELGEAFVAIAELIKPTVVYIRAETVEQQPNVRVPRGFEEFFRNGPRSPRLKSGQGSGFIISRDGYILTNNHVVEGASRLRVTLLDKRVFEAEVVGRDPATDVAVIKIDAHDLPAASFGDSDSLRVGEWVLAVGNPLGQAFSFTVTAGIVSGMGRLLEGLPIESQYRIMDFIQTDAAINPGNSGGPLVNIRGQVVGINSAIASNTGFYQGYGFAIPMNLVRLVADQLISQGSVTRAILGVRISAVRPEDAEFVGLDEIRGVLVEDFSIEDSPARIAGIRQGDVIVELDGEPVQYVAQLQQEVAFRRPGETVNVTVMRRGGERKVIPVRLGEAPRNATTVARAEPAEFDASAPHETKLGIAVRPLTEDEAAAIEKRVGTGYDGLRVMEIDVWSPAHDRLCPSARQQCGFGDIITHVNGEPVRTIDEFDAALAGIEAGAVVSLRVLNPDAGGGQGLSRVVRVRVQ